MAIHCVNYNSHAVIDIASELGVSPLVAAAKISLWQDLNGVDSFPEAKDLNTPSQEEEAEVEKKVEEPVGERGLSEDVNFADLGDPETPNSIPDNGPYYDQSENVFADSLFNANADDLSVDNILSNIIHKIPNITPQMQELAVRANKLLGRSKSKLTMVSEDKMDTATNVMQYDPLNKEIQVSLDRLKNFSDEDVTVAFLHEVVHGLTVDALAKNPKDRTIAEQELADVVTKFMDKHKNSALAKEYGFKDEYEFVAEFYANPDFRDKVKEVSQGFWNQLLSALRRYFNLPLTTEYTTLFNTIVDFTEQNINEDFQGDIKYPGIFSKEIEFVKPELVSFENRLNDTINKIKDRISQARSRTAKTKKPISKKNRKDHLKNIDALLKEIDKLSETEQIKVILEYAKTLNKTVMQVDKLFDRLISTTKDFRQEDLLTSINSYESYLAAYDLIKDINDLISSSITQKTLSEEDKVDFKAITDIISFAAGKRDLLESKFHAIKTEQAIKILADPKNNTQIETDYRTRLYKEYAEKGITGESRIEYASRMLSTRDKAAYEADLVKAAEKIVYNPTFDISKFTKDWEDPLNTNSKFIQILTNIFSQARDTIVALYKDYDLGISKLHTELIKEKGNKAPSELYKDLYEQDKDGNYFFKGKWSIKFRDIYLGELIPMEKELEELTQKLKSEGVLLKADLLKNVEYKELKNKIATWMKEHTVKDASDIFGRRWYPKLKYKNKPITGVNAEFLKEAIALAKQGNTATGGSRSLVRRTGQAEFYKFPSITKSDFERGIEKDLKGIYQQKKSDLFEIKPDDVGYGEAISPKGETIRGVKVHYRGKIDPSSQSLDVATMLRMEFFNVASFTEKSKAEVNAIMISDIVKNKPYLQKSKKTGLPLLNAFNKNQPVETIPGEFTNEYSRIKGLMDRMIYDVFHEHGGKFGPADINKIASYVNGATASIAMSFNVASGTANVLNGFTQLFIESFGGDVINPKNLLKAEKRYTTELPKTLADLGSPTKKSFVNQMLEMYDVVGGFDPATQEFIRNTIARKLASRKNMNGLNEMGEHAMNSVLTMAVLDSLKVMNIKNKFIDKDGNEVSEEKAASLLDMLKMDANGKLVMDKNVKFTRQNLTTEYDKGGKMHVNLLIKSKVFDIYGVYDNNFKNEMSKKVSGKLVMMFKNYFLGGLAYRYTGISTSLKAKDDLTEDDLNYSSAKKEYTEGTYVSLIRYLRHGVLPTLKSLQLMYMKDVYNSLSEHEKANLKKATIEIAITAAILPAIGMMLGAAAGPDDDELWFAIYQFRRLESELAQFRNPLEITKLATNPVAGLKLVQSVIKFAGEIATPINLMPNDDEHVFSYLDEDVKHHNELGKATKKLVPIWAQLDKDYHQLWTIIN